MHSPYHGEKCSASKRVCVTRENKSNQAAGGTTASGSAIMRYIVKTRSPSSQAQRHHPQRRPLCVAASWRGRASEHQSGAVPRHRNSYVVALGGVSSAVIGAISSRQHQRGGASSAQPASYRPSTARPCPAAARPRAMRRNVNESRHQCAPTVASRHHAAVAGHSSMAAAGGRAKPLK